MVEIDDIPAAGLDLSIHAEAREREALARRAGLVAIESLAADFRLLKRKESEVDVAGLLRARVVQTCVVSLEPFESDIEAPIEADFVGSAATDAIPSVAHRWQDDRRGSEKVRGVELDAPEPIVDGRIDLGALAAEFLVLALDPYPHKPGVTFDEAEFSGASAETDSPFAALARLRGPSRR